MSVDRDLASPETLMVPEALKPNPDVSLPVLDGEVLSHLREAGWSRVGLMVAVVDSDGAVMMLQHNLRDKNSHGALGPLGETSQESGPIIEQPLQTLYRGVQEELGIQQPADLQMWMFDKGGWVVNQWPRGDGYSGEYACAISFPIFVTDSVRARLLSIPHGTEEIGGLYDFMSPEEIQAMDEDRLRPGVKPWLRQLDEAGLLTPGFSQLQEVDFSSIFEASLHDIDLQE